MPLTSLTLARTFGVELELLGPRQEMTRHLAQVLDAGPPDEATAPDAVPVSTRRFGTWTSVKETSLRPTDEHPGCRELVSPIFRFGSPADRAKVTGVVRALNRGGFIVNDSCGLHVHVGVDRAKDPELILSALAHAFEWGRLIHALLRDVRLDSDFCEAPTPWYVAQLAGFFTGESAPTYKRLMRGLLNMDAKAAECAGKLDLPRNYAVNLSALILHGTIEYRFFAGTLDPDLVLAYVELCARFTSLIMSTLPRLHARREPTAANVRALFERLELSPHACDVLWSPEVRAHVRKLSEPPRVRLPRMNLSMLDNEARRLADELIALYPT